MANERIAETVERLRDRTEVKPLPCPWCGLAMEVREVKTQRGTTYYTVECDDSACPVQPGVDATTPEEALQRWNTRASNNEESRNG